MQSLQSKYLISLLQLETLSKILVLSLVYTYISNEFAKCKIPKDSINDIQSLCSHYSSLIRITEKLYKGTLRKVHEKKPIVSPDCKMQEQKKKIHCVMSNNNVFQHLKSCVYA